MLGGETNPSTLRAADHQGHGGPASQHVADLRRLVHDLVHGHGDEVPDLDLHDGPHPRHRRSHPHAHERRLRDRGVTHAVLAEAITQSLGHLEDAPDQSHVLPHEEDPLVPRHLAVQGGVERLREGHLASRAARGLRHSRVRRVHRGLHHLHGGLGALASVGHRGIELTLHAQAQLLDLELARPHVHEAPLHAGHGILLDPLELLLLGAVLGQIGAHAVAAPAIGDGLHAARPLAPTGAGHRLPHRLVHGEQVVAVYARGRDAVRAGARRHSLPRRGARLVGAEGVLVVLAHEDEGKLPHRGEVHGLVHHALVRSPVAEERDDHAIGFPELVGKRCSRADGHPCGHDAVGAQHVQIESGDMHGPA